MTLNAAPPWWQPCACKSWCGDDGDVDGPGVCKGLPRQPEPPLIEIVLVPRWRAGQKESA
jgi:hypothetical protein